MKPILVVLGHGPGISEAVARRFGAEGFALALVARNAERLSAAAAALGAAGFSASPFSCDLGDPAAVRSLFSEIRASMGRVSILHWNAYAGGAGDLTTAPVDELRAAIDVSVHGLVAAVQEALPDLKENRGAVLVTGGGFGLHDAKVDAMVVQLKFMGLAVAKAAQHKVAGLLHQRRAPASVSFP